MVTRAVLIQMMNDFVAPKRMEEVTGADGFAWKLKTAIEAIASRKVT